MPSLKLYLDHSPAILALVLRPLFHFQPLLRFWMSLERERKEESEDIENIYLGLRDSRWYVPQYSKMASAQNDNFAYLQPHSIIKHVKLL